MRILVTGHDGYIGTVLVKLFQLVGHEVVGADSGLFSGCTFTPELGRPETELSMDIRDLREEHLDGVDAVVHLAGIASDPLGDLNPATTDDVNHLATLHVARTAKAAGVPRFVFASSSSIYAAHGDDILDETAPLLPLTSYAESKVRAEQELAKLADDEFTPTFLRPAIAYGVSPRLRGDLVVNDLVGSAVTTGRVLVPGDGSPRQPLVHVEDIARGFLAVLEAPREVVHGKAYNVGRTEETYRIAEVAEIVADVVPGSTVSVADGAGPDPRSYRVDCSLIADELPAFQPQWTVRRGIEELYDAYLQVNLTEEMLTGARLQRMKHVMTQQERGLLDARFRMSVGEGARGA